MSNLPIGLVKYRFFKIYSGIDEIVLKFWIVLKYAKGRSQHYVNKIGLVRLFFGLFLKSNPKAKLQVAFFKKLQK